jgi:hypothetical protein
MHTLIRKTIDHLGSPDIAVDNRHGPKIYARFLEGLIATSLVKVDLAPNEHKSSESPPHKKTSRRPKSASSSQSPEPERHLEVPTVTPPSIVAAGVRSSPSPKPSHAALSFDMFAPMLAGADPFAPASARTRNQSGAVEQGQTEMGLNAEFFQQPSFDDTFMRSMQTLFADDAMNWDTNATGVHDSTYHLCILLLAGLCAILL